MSINNLFYTLVDTDFYDTLDQYTPNDEQFLVHVQKRLPSQWTIERNSVWYACTNPDAGMPAQGWKIHLSSIYMDAAPMLTVVASVLADYKINFKFAADKFMLCLLNSKRWGRGGSGKFITIYPPTRPLFLEVIEHLYQLLCGYQGPYILSDRRYKNSSVIYYRYGGFLPNKAITITGESRAMIQDPSGKWSEDERLSQFKIPGWEVDPFEERHAEQDNHKNTLNNGRFSLEATLAVASSGGVYLGRDNNDGRSVVIKEARPWTNLHPYGFDSIALLKKEYRLLKRVEAEQIAPRPLALFQDWEHLFLVQEYLEGMPLRGYASGHCLPIVTRVEKKHSQEFCSWFFKLYPAIARLIACLHKYDIVFADLSHNNILVLRDTKEPKLIDFEAAYEIGVDSATLIYTPGFATEEQGGGRAPLKSDDCFALGGVLLASLTPTANFYPLQPLAQQRYIDALWSDFHLPVVIRKCISQLMAPDALKRISASEAAHLLATHSAIEVLDPTIRADNGEDEKCQRIVDEGVRFINSSATLSRFNRLYPADPTLFATNPLSIGYGAVGVACVLNRVTGGVSQAILDWILSHPVELGSYPPGLYLGISGIAWGLLELGLRDVAVKYARSVSAHPLINDSADLFWGASGYGLSQLKFFLETQDEAFLAQAESVAFDIIRARKEAECGWYWPCQGETYFGLGHGASGIALFMLYLYLTSGNEEFLRAGQRAMDFEFSRAERLPTGELRWRQRESSRTVLPYWRWGTAGIGMTALRYWSVLKDSVYESMLRQLIPDVNRKYTIMPGRFFGLAGLGEFFLDLATLTDWNEDESIAGARRVAAGIMLFAVERPEGVTFPGEELLRLSCDYGTGSAGIILFLHRLINRGVASFMLDELLLKRSTPAAVQKQQPVVAQI